MKKKREAFAKAKFKQDQYKQQRLNLEPLSSQSTISSFSKLKSKVVNLVEKGFSPAAAPSAFTYNAPAASASQTALFISTSNTPAASASQTASFVSTSNSPGASASQTAPFVSTSNPPPASASQTAPSGSTSNAPAAFSSQTAPIVSTFNAQATPLCISKKRASLLITS